MGDEFLLYSYLMLDLRFVVFHPHDQANKRTMENPFSYQRRVSLSLFAWSCGYSARISSMSRLVSDKKAEEKDQKICSSSSAWPCMAPSSASADRSEPRGSRLRRSLNVTKLGRAEIMTVKGPGTGPVPSAESFCDGRTTGNSIRDGDSSCRSRRCCHSSSTERPPDELRKSRSGQRSIWRRGR